MCTASVAINVAKVGEEVATEWISIVAFGAVGEALAQHVKGDLISAMGPLTRSTFTGRDGQGRCGWSLLAEASSRRGRLGAPEPAH
jgi:single-stranded DNA-binding protein